MATPATGPGRKPRRTSATRKALLAAYGQRCNCCGETREIFLTVDHIDGGGNDHRRSLGGTRRASTEEMYRDIVRRGCPDDFQLLCFNCNYAKYRLGMCIHQLERQSA